MHILDTLAHTRTHRVKVSDLGGLRVNLIDPINPALTLKYRDLNQSTPRYRRAVRARSRAITPPKPRCNINDAENHLHRAKFPLSRYFRKGGFLHQIVTIFKDLR